MVEEAIARAEAYAAAGADGLFAPGLADLGLIRRLASAITLPLNIMRLDPAQSLAELADAGAARISHGPYPYLVAMGALESAARGNRLGD